MKTNNEFNNDLFDLSYLYETISLLISKITRISAGFADHVIHHLSDEKTECPFDHNLTLLLLRLLPLTTNYLCCCSIQLVWLQLKKNTFHSPLGFRIIQSKVLWSNWKSIFILHRWIVKSFNTSRCREFAKWIWKLCENSKLPCSKTYKMPMQVCFASSSQLSSLL